MRRPLDHFLKQNSGAEVICLYITDDLVHRLADADLSRLMINNIDAVECGRDSRRITHIAAHEFGFFAQVGRRLGAVDLLNERIEDPHTMTFFYQSVNEVRADKSGSARN